MTCSSKRALASTVLNPALLKKSLQRLTFGLLTGSLLLSNAAFAETITPAQVDGVYVFGDSLVDTGNIYQISSQQQPLSPPYYQGRFSNGPLWVEDLLANLSISLSPSTLGGTDFAVGGATTGQLGVLLQIRKFLTSAPTITPNTLYFVTAGGNDFLNNASLNPKIPVNNLVTAVSSLYAYGARNVVVTNLPDLGKIPEVNSDPQESAALSAVTIEFNRKLKKALAELEVKRPGLNVIWIDTYSLLNSIMANPTPYGITNIKDACVEGTYTEPTTPCENPDQYLFWDTVHPTRATGQVFANFAYQRIFGNRP
ncbi:MAG: SGNH/GDSL hydrolase family protein [Anaerolineae bacterium]|nr:SGNH/GDSL hydrolase family protein [Gloeobacterales cyanobacterium ES-bin-313]